MPQGQAAMRWRISWAPFFFVFLFAVVISSWVMPSSAPFFFFFFFAVVISSLMPSSAPFFFFFFFAVVISSLMITSAPFFFFFFFAVVMSSLIVCSSTFFCFFSFAVVFSSLMFTPAPFFFFFFFAVVISSLMMISAPFFFFFFFAAERSSLFTAVPSAGVANTGVRLVEPRKPSAAIIAVNLRMMDILICHSPGRECGGDSAASQEVVGLVRADGPLATSAQYTTWLRGSNEIGLKTLIYP